MSLLANISNALGSYVLLNKQALIDQYMQKSVTEAYCSTILSDAQDGQTVGLPSDQLSEVVQNFQPVFTAKGDFSLQAETVIQRRHKINVSINPDAIVGKWEGYLYDESVSREEMPITKYIMDKLSPKVDEDKELQMVYKGVYVAPTPGVASPANASVHGFGKIMDLASTAGKYAKFALGDFDQDETFEYVESVFTSIPEIHRMRKLNMFMSETTALWYQQDKRNTFKYFEQLGTLLKIDFSNINMIALPSMNGSKRIFVTPPGNMVRVIHKNQSADNIEVQRLDYLVKVLADFHTCYGISDYRYFWSNDQA